ncbi:Cell division protein FtsI [Peptidoglycan synthetase] [hydrothermal vent metagenome]|uniref:Cell division protein FtsI [Peptidoglycan synthetase] n=1 Tax=hydrothermal vent metagenome TaxID=652676 RepID=A0A1W1EG41_9ZZZZ
MAKNRAEKRIDNKKRKISVLFGVIIFLFLIFLYSVFKTIINDRRIPSHNSTIHDRSFRGNIVSADDYILSSSKKTYKAVIRGASIDPNKKELFIKLFSIYSDIPEDKIRKKFKNKKGKEKKGNIVLSKTIDSRNAMQLKSLAYKLRKLDVFQSIRTRSGIEILYGLDIIENGESRRFPLHDVLSPILGYVGKKEENGYIRPRGKKGLERNYETYIRSKKDGYFRGKRDVNSRIIHNKKSFEKLRVDGLNLHLNIPLALQRRVEMMLDSMKSKIDADEIIVGAMESNTGKLVTLASSERYDPSHITQKDIPALNPKFSEYPYEAGSVMKPLTISIALDKGVVTPDTWFNTYGGKLQIGRRNWISDDHKFDSLTVTDIIVNSSNVGTSQIAWRLTGQEFREGLLKFGVARKSGIDLSRDLPGQVKPVYKLNNKLHSASTSYGYGMLITFSQLLKAYSAFNNDGIAVTPKIVNYLEDRKGNQYTLKPRVGDLHACSKKTANQMHNILLEVVKRGTGKAAIYPGLEVGGKTGTAHIAKNGRYVREYHSSFYGFANDKFGNKYTIGVLVIRAKKRNKYFASQSAVPTFRNIVELLVEQGKLTPDPELIKKVEEEQDMYTIEEPKPSSTESVKKKPLKTKKRKVKPIKKEPAPEPIQENEPAMPSTTPSVQPPPQYENIEDLF